MAHFVELDENNIVLRVIVVHDNECKDQNGKENEEIGAAFCNSLFGGRWIQTSYNHRIRKQYAGIGYAYDQQNDVFISPKPFPSWSIDSNHDWQPPVAHPDDDKPYYWDEEQLNWIEILQGE